MRKAIMLMILVFAVAFLPCLALAKEAVPTLRIAKLDGISGGGVRPEKRIQQCKAEGQINRAAGQDSLASGCLLGDERNNDTEPGELFQINPELREFEIYAY